MGAINAILWFYLVQTVLEKVNSIHVNILNFPWNKRIKPVPKDSANIGNKKKKKKKPWKKKN